MFQIFLEEPIITAGIGGFWTFSLLTRILLGLAYRNMIRQSDNMAITNNRMLKQCKLKFANCYELNHGVPNIPVFVDKFLNRLSIGPFSFETLYHLSGQSMLLSVIFSGAGICAAIMRGHTVGDILPFYILSFLGLYLYFSVSSMVDLKGKKRVLKTNLVDYLENHLAARIGVTESDMRMLYGDAVQGGRRASRRRRTLELMPIGNRNASEELSSMSDPEQDVIPFIQPDSQIPPMMNVVPPMPQSVLSSAHAASVMSQSILPTAQADSPMSQSVFSSAQTMSPMSQMISPTAQAESPMSQTISSSSQAESPMSQTISPTMQAILPATQVSSQAMPQGELSAVQRSQAISQPAIPASSQASPFYISGEELEALIKEFC